MTNILKYYTTLFLFGFFAYGLLEVIWRGFTHPTMSIAGGVSIIFIDTVAKRLSELSIIYKALICGLFITLIEFIIGYIMNVNLDAGIWDYSLMPLNLMGQVCFSFSVLWCFISIPLILILGRKNKSKDIKRN